MKTVSGQPGLEPHRRLASLIERAEGLELKEPNAFLLSTVSSTGLPSSRVVLLKYLDDRGLVFYTNLTSRKGQEIQENPRVALSFYWREMGEQVRVEGLAAQVNDDEADAYFASRDRRSRLGAWASKQSTPLDSRARLLARVAKYEAKFLGGPVPRPEFWSGFRVEPKYFEFWSTSAFRLHDRIIFAADDSGWTQSRLYP